MSRPKWWRRPDVAEYAETMKEQNAMTDYTDLKARLRAVFDLERISSEVDHVLIDTLAYIEDLEQRIQSMGGSSMMASVTEPKNQLPVKDGEPPAQSSWREELRTRVRATGEKISDARFDELYDFAADIAVKLDSAAPAPAAEPVAWALLEDLNLVQLERMAVEKEASDEQRIPCFISVEWVQRAVAAWRNAAPQPAQADEAREIIAEAYTRLGIDPQFAARCEAYLARTGGKEEQ